MSIAPIFCPPIYKQKVWGGRNLESRLKRTLPPGPIGESWELSGHGSDSSVVSDGPFTGTPLRELCTRHHDDILGAGVSGDALPLLYKFIDANDNLSVQVHPNDDQAVANAWDLRGKTECWYIADAAPGAQIIVGVQRGATIDSIRRGVETSTLEHSLNRIPISAGDCLFIPAGTVHAILKGTLLYEVQQTSDITLRLYDWGRLEDGKPRALHVKESLAVIDTAWRDDHKVTPIARPSGAPGVTRRMRASCGYFILEDLIFDRATSAPVQARGVFQVVTVVRGKATLTCSTGLREINQGDTVLIPAMARDITLAAGPGTVLLLSGVPNGSYSVSPTH